MLSSWIRGWRGVALIAATYVYFLIFAQFAFLGRLAEVGIAGGGLKIVMGAMALGGVLASLLAPGLIPFVSKRTVLRTSFAICGLAALGALLPLDLTAAAMNGFVIGIGLGLLTVTLVTHLPDWTGSEDGLIKVGLGTGVGYFICNVPAIFAASPERQAVVAAVVCVLGMLVCGGAGETSGPEPTVPGEKISFGRALAGFTALVWLDSAAFYIIQHTAVLKAGTWMGSAHLWTNACIHLAVALGAAVLLRRRGLGLVLAFSFCMFAAACLLLMNGAHVPTASLFYPAGVSLYSTALVAYPAFLSGAETAVQRGRQAGLIYAVAGWIGSGLGIGMGQNLGHVPLWFVAVAGAVVLGPVLYRVLHMRRREVAVIAAAAVMALGVARIRPSHSDKQMLTPSERGRRVYISEGCIHCHSQYVRPNTADVLLWGPVVTLEQVREEKPPLIGNRRQGPDLSQVGVRRSPLWLKAHLIDPAEVSGRSVMPSYAFLFKDERGNDLVAYLASLHSGDVASHMAQEQAWRPSAAAMREANPADGAAVYETFCATCHDSDGAARRRWGANFTQVPADLRNGPFRYLKDEDANARALEIARIAKFGINGTDMPGHEYLSDEQIAAVGKWLADEEAHMNPHTIKTGEKE
jgi:cbb3-type cytochrome c oxidase subunit II